MSRSVLSGLKPRGVAKWFLTCSVFISDKTLHTNKDEVCRVIKLMYVMYYLPFDSVIGLRIINGF